MHYPKMIQAASNTDPHVAVQLLNQALLLYQSLYLVDSKLLRSRHQRVAAKRSIEVCQSSFASTGTTTITESFLSTTTCISISTGFCFVF